MPATRAPSPTTASNHTVEPVNGNIVVVAADTCAGGRVVIDTSVALCTDVSGSQVNVTAEVGLIPSHPPFAVLVMCTVPPTAVLTLGVLSAGSPAATGIAVGVLAFLSGVTVIISWEHVKRSFIEQTAQLPHPVVTQLCAVSDAPTDPRSGTSDRPLPVSVA